MLVLAQDFLLMERQIRYAIPVRNAVTYIIERGWYIMPRRGENIYKRKDGRWEGRYIKEYDIEGKSHYGYIYGKSYTEVKSKLKNVQASKTPFGGNAGTRSVPYEQILNLWLASAKIKVKESTYSRYNHLITRHICPALGNYLISRIGTQMVEQYIRQLLSTGRIDGKGGLAPKSVSDILTIIKDTMEYARDLGYPVICNLGKISIKQNAREMRVLSVDEQNRLEKYLLEDTDLLKFGTLLCLYTGIRIGEVCALRWEHLCLDQGTLSVRETLQRVQNVSALETEKTRIIITEPKSKCSMRVIPLPHFLIEIARKFEAPSKAFVLTGEKDKYVEPRTLQNKFKRYMKACNIPEINYHALRHTFATRCIELGFEVKSLSEILGHANVNITLNRYVHASFDLKRENMDKLDAVVNL